MIREEPRDTASEKLPSDVYPIHANLSMHYFQQICFRLRLR